jgi:hypothetical protein
MVKDTQSYLVNGGLIYFNWETGSVTAYERLGAVCTLGICFIARENSRIFYSLQKMIGKVSNPLQ